MLGWLGAGALGSLAIGEASAATLPDAARWSDDDVRASRREFAAAAVEPPQREAAASAGAIAVVELGGRRLTLLDDRRFETRQRIALERSVQGEPVFSRDGRQLYVAGADGWIVKIDPRAGAVRAEVRAGPRLVGLAASSDGRWLLAASEAPHRVLLFDDALVLRRSWPGATRDGTQASRIADVHDVAARRSFVVTLRDVGELWEISYDPRAEDIYEGLVHDFRMGEGVPMRGFHNARRSKLPEPLRGLAFRRGGYEAIGTAAREGAEAGVGQVVNLDVRKRILTLALGGRPAFDGAAHFERDGRSLLAVPRRDRGGVAVIDPARWAMLRDVATPRPARRLRGHAGAPWLWAEALPGDDGAPMAIDKATLEPVDLPPGAGGTIRRIAFSADGVQALVLAGDGGAATLSVRDGATLRETRRLPLDAPVALVHSGG